MSRRLLIILGVFFAQSAFTAYAQLRIVQYNCGQVKPDLHTILEQIGNEQVNGVAKPIDIMTIEEQNNQTDVNEVRDVLNGIYGAGTYVAAPYTGTSSGGGLPGMV